MISRYPAGPGTCLFISLALRVKKAWAQDVAETLSTKPNGPLPPGYDVGHISQLPLCHLPEQNGCHSQA